MINSILILKKPIILYFFICIGITCSSQQEIWKEKPSMSICRAFHAMATYGGNIYVMGGSTGKKSEFRDTTSVEMYNRKTEKWEKKSPMPYAITTSCAVTSGNKIFIVGGQENVFDTRIRKVLMYDCETDTWHSKSPMNIARAFHSTVALNNKLYAIGGRENPDEINSKIKDSLAVFTIEEYDIANDKWCIKTVMPDKHFIIGAVALYNKIYMLADTASNFKLSSAAIFEEYDPTNNTFRRLESLSPSRYDAAMVVSDNKIYVLGGWIYGAISNVDVYDPVNDNWEKGNDLPYPVQNLQAISINCNIFISGGIIYPEDGNEKKKNVLEYSNCGK